jgi:hypothetical protein
MRSLRVCFFSYDEDCVTRDDGGLRPLFRKHLPMVDWQPVETGVISSGVPDVNGCYRGVEWWMECKATAAFGVRFQPHQPAWIHRRYRAGGRVWVAVRRQHGGGVRRGPPVDELLLVPGQHVLVLAQQGLVPGLVVAHWPGGPGNWHWPGVLACLTGLGE